MGCIYKAIIPNEMNKVHMYSFCLLREEITYLKRNSLFVNEIEYILRTGEAWKGLIKKRTPSIKHSSQCPKRSRVCPCLCCLLVMKNEPQQNPGTEARHAAKYLDPISTLNSQGSLSQ